MRELGLFPDGDLFKMQQRAIMDAKLAVEKSIYKDEKTFDKPLSSTYNITKPSNKSKSINLPSFDFSKYITKFFKDFGIEEIILILLIGLLIVEEADIELILGLSFILITGSL